MRLDHPVLLLASVVFVLLAALPSMAKVDRSILFGVNYLPFVTCVEDFGPHWRTDNWTEKRVVNDLKIMKAIGCSGVRIPIHPAIPGKIRAWGVPAEKYLPMLDLTVKTANELGIKVHLDIDVDVEIGDNGEEGVRFCLDRYKGKVESYQIGNECYDLPDSKERLEWLQRLLEIGHSVDPKAIISADILVPDWVKIRKEMPELYKSLGVALAHYYSVTDHRGWNDIYIDDLVDYLSNPTGRHSAAMKTYDATKSLKDYGTYDPKILAFDHPWYVGSYGWLDKEIWLSEVTSHGYWRWGSLVPEDTRAANWEKLIDAIAAAKNRVTRVYHWCFRDKMSNREYGSGQCGIVHYDGAPRQASFAFRKMAMKYAPQDSALGAVNCEVERVDVPDGASSVELNVKVANTSGKALAGQLLLELPDNTTAKQHAFCFDIAAGKSKSWKVPIDVSRTHWGANHTFARVEIPQGIAYGWGVIAKRKRLEVSPVSPLSDEAAKLVTYRTSLEEIQKFFDDYGDKLGIVFGPGIGADAEMAHRFRTIIDAMRCREVVIRSCILSVDILDRPLIVIGTPEYNIISRTVEIGLPKEQRVTPTEPGPGRGIISIVKEPFGQPNAEGRSSKQAEQIGYYYQHCPAVLYIAGSDNKGTEVAAYDLIGRIWGKDEKYR